MRNKWLVLLLISICAACTRTDRNVKTLGVPKLSPREHYDHNIHEKPRTQADLDCTDCHPFKLDWSKRTVELPQYKELFVKPLDQICHDCHRKESRVHARIFVCSLCHEETRELTPENHKAGWIKKHAVLSYHPSECQTCHDDSYCIDCHRRFETIRPQFHGRNYRFYHSIEARMNPALCYSCHRISQCSDCHQNGETFR